jgi:hypothetical protein
LKVLSTIAVTLVALSGGIGAVNAQKYLTGEISGNYPAGEYIVSGNIYVLPETKLTFDPGCILRFENYTGIVVRGELICIGSPLQPVVFTSSRDILSTQSVPEAFDWNGIKVTSESDGITLENCVIAYSTFGLNIESNATPVSIKGTNFHNNGSASLTREKKMMPVTDNLGISFVWPEIQQAETVSDPVEKDRVEKDKSARPPQKNNTQKTAKKVQSKKEYAKPKGAWKQPVRIIFGSTAGIGGIMWATGFIASEQNRNITHNPTVNYQVKSDADIKYKNWLAIQNLGIGLFCIGATGFSVTFFF